MITITATVDTAVAQPRIRLDVVANATAPGVDPGGRLSLYRVNPDGTQKRVIVDANATLIGGSWSGFDYHCPFNQQVQYIASASAVNSSMTPATLPSTVSWLIHPNNPALSVQLDAVADFADQAFDGSAVLSFPYSGVYPISLTEGVQRAPTGQLTARVDSQAKAQALQALLADGGPMLMNLASKDPGAWWDQPWAWIQRATVTPLNPAKNLNGTSRKFVIPYQVIDTPAGAALPLWTCDNVTATYATCDQVTTTYSSCSGLATNTINTPASGGLVLNPDGTYPGLYTGSLTSLNPDTAHAGLYFLS